MNTELNYYKIDPTWEMFKLKNKEEYADRFVIKSCFHSNVSEDVIKSFKTAEYLMAHAYFHYPMYDEAVLKILGIFEMSIKLRSKELGNSIETVNRSGRKKPKNLSVLINELNRYNYPRTFVEKLHYIREMRNSQVHQDRYSFGGAFMKNVCYYLLNGINDVFLDPEIIQQREDRLVALKNSNSREGLYITRERRLGYDPVPLYTWLNDSTWITAYSFKPVMVNTKERLEKNPFIESFLLILKNEKFNDLGVKGIDALTDEEIFFEKTTKQQNLDWYREHLDAVNDYNRNVQIIPLNRNSGRLHDDIEKFRYGLW